MVWIMTSLYDVCLFHTTVCKTKIGAIKYNESGKNWDFFERIDLVILFFFVIKKWRAKSEQHSNIDLTCKRFGFLLNHINFNVSSAGTQMRCQKINQYNWFGFEQKKIGNCSLLMAKKDKQINSLDTFDRQYNYP